MTHGQESSGRTNCDRRLRPKPHIHISANETQYPTMLGTNLDVADGTPS